MRTIRIYQNSALIPNLELELSVQAAHHVRTVLRLNPGQSLQIFNGQNQQAESEILEMSKKRVLVAVRAVESRSLESPLALHLAQALIKGERMEWLIRKSAELGVRTITPILTERLAVKLSDARLAKKIQQWQAIAVSACEQCGRNTIPKIADAVDFSDFVTEKTIKPQTLILDPRSKNRLSDLNLSQQSTVLLIGPEGGFSEDERRLALNHHYQAARLGPRILRAETAAVVSQTLLQAQLGDL